MCCARGDRTENLVRELNNAIEPAANDPAQRFSGLAANALELSVTEAVTMGTTT